MMRGPTRGFELISTDGSQGGDTPGGLAALEAVLDQRIQEAEANCASKQTVGMIFRQARDEEETN